MTMTKNSKTLMAPNQKELIISILLLVFSYFCALSDADDRFIHTNISLEADENNRGLSDGPRRPCKAQKLISSTSFKLGFMIGYVIFTVSITAVFLYYYVPRTHVKEAKELVLGLAASLLNNNNKMKIAHQDRELSTLQVIQIPKLESMVLRMSLAQLMKGTDNFRVDNIIGFGKMGTMYKAMLPNGKLVAVKMIIGFQLITEEFEFELKILGSYRHINCVPLLGFCIEPAARLLVYRYMSNGNLHSWLNPEEKGAKILEWPLRVKIAVGLARGLAWLHHICRVRVVHLNISSKSVLLDQNFEPKLSNFGKAMLMNPNDIGLNKPRGFSINKEFWELDFMKKDVFDFGVVFLELITGEDLGRDTKSRERFDWSILEKWKCKISTQIQKGVLDCEILECLVGMAFNCIQPFPERRPTMLEIYRKLRIIGETYGVVDYFEIE